MTRFLRWFTYQMEYRFWKSACKYADLRDVVRDLGAVMLWTVSAGLVLVGLFIVAMGVVAA